MQLNSLVSGKCWDTFWDSAPKAITLEAAARHFELDATSLIGLPQTSFLARSRPDIERLYGYDASALPAEGPWYASGWESDSQSRERANGVSNWIKSAEFRELNENKIVVFVMHGNFIDHLQKAMMNIPEDATIDSKVTNDHTVHPVSFGTPNTATSLFFVFKDGRISVRYIGNVAHLNSCLETSYGRL